MKREKGGFWVGFAASVFYPVGAILARRHYLGAERIPRDGGALLVMNHVSHLDPIFDTVFVHKQGRVPHVFAKHTLWEKPIVRQVMAGSGQIPVYRGSSAAGYSLRDGLQALRDGKVVITYPEGTITRDPEGWPMVSRTGAARLALDMIGTGVPVLPVARWGTRVIYDGYRKQFHPFPRHDVTFSVGEPVDLGQYRDRAIDGPLLREVTDLLMGRVAALLSGIRGEPAPAEFYHPQGVKPSARQAPSSGTDVPAADGDAPRSDTPARGSETETTGT